MAQEGLVPIFVGADVIVTPYQYEKGCIGSTSTFLKVFNSYLVSQGTVKNDQKTVTSGESAPPSSHRPSPCAASSPASSDRPGTAPCTHLSYSDRIIHPSSHSMTFLWISPSGMSLTTESRDSTVLG